MKKIIFICLLVFSLIGCDYTVKDLGIPQTHPNYRLVFVSLMNLGGDAALKKVYEIFPTVVEIFELNSNSFYVLYEIKER